MSYAPLLAHIARYVQLTPAEQQWLCGRLRVLPLPRKELLLAEGHICTANYFILRGCLRTYFLTEQGREQTIYFSIENWWVTDYASLDTHRPSHYAIQAVEDCELVVFDRAVQEEVFGRLPQLERYFRLILQRVTAASQFRMRFLLSISGEARYRMFVRAQPEFVQRVPQYMLASYLGFTPEFLSKIRAKMGHD